MKIMGKKMFHQSFASQFNLCRYNAARRKAEAAWGAAAGPDLGHAVRGGAVQAEFIS
jgi:hypothetical protein